MYMRTDLGSQELLQRNLKLSTRLRTLLLLIESNDFYKLDQKILNDEHLAILLDHALITKKDSPIDFDDQVNIVKVEQTTEIILQQEDPKPIENQLIKKELAVKQQIESTELSVLDLNQVKSLMMDTLQKYSGLMSKQLIIAIEHAQTFEELRSYQKKWLTNLFETKICRNQLNQLLQNINQSMQRIDA